MKFTVFFAECHQELLGHRELLHQDVQLVQDESTCIKAVL